jgi:fructose-1,6-bisphosphatase/inositol monophosphatase family enzyme
VVAQPGCGKTDRFKFGLALCVSTTHLQDGVLQIGMVNEHARCELFAGGSRASGLCYVAAGRLVGFFEPLIKSWDCLGAIAVVHAAGLKTSDFLANDGLWKGNPILAGNADVLAELEEFTDVGKQEVKSKR